SHPFTPNVHQTLSLNLWRFPRVIGRSKGRTLKAQFNRSCRVPRQLFCVALCSWLLLAFRHTRSCLRGRVLPKSVPNIGVLASRQLMTDGQNISPKTRTNGRMLATRCRARGVDHLRVCRSHVSGNFPEQIFPDPAPRPAHEGLMKPIF